MSLFSFKKVNDPEGFTSYEFGIHIDLFYVAVIAGALLFAGGLYLAITAFC